MVMPEAVLDELQLNQGDIAIFRNESLAF